MGGVRIEGDVCKNRKFRQFFFEGTDRPINQPLGIEGFLGVGRAHSLGDTGKDGDSADATAGESLRFSDKGGDRKTKMTGKAGDGLRFAISFRYEKGSHQSERGNLGL